MSPLRLTYAALCLIGAALPFSQFGPWLSTNGLALPLLAQQAFGTPISAFAWLDVLVSAATLALFIVVEGRRRGVAHWWWALVGLCLVGVSLGLPLFLYLREGQMARQRTAPAGA